MKMVTVKQYALKMASSESQIRQMCADGIIPSVKIGKGYKIDEERADNYFAREIDKRLNEQRKKDDKKIIRANKKKSPSTFISRIDELIKKGVKKNVEQDSVCSNPRVACE